MMAMSSHSGRYHILATYTARSSRWGNRMLSGGPDYACKGEKYSSARRWHEHEKTLRDLAGKNNETKSREGVEATRQRMVGDRAGPNRVGLLESVEARVNFAL